MIRWTRFFFAALFVGAGVLVLAPAPASATSYTLFISYFYESTASHVRMDEQGNLFHVRDYDVGPDARSVSASPNGRVVIVGSEYAVPHLSAFFLDPNGNVLATDYFTFEGTAQGAPLAFHRRLQVLYAGYGPCRAVQIDYAKLQISDFPPSFEMQTNPPRIFYSAACEAILYNDWYDDHVKAVGLNSEGHFTSVIGDLDLSPDLVVQGSAISPRGDHATITGRSRNELNTFRVETRGIQWLRFWIPACAGMT